MTDRVHLRNGELLKFHALEDGIHVVIADRLKDSWTGKTRQDAISNLADSLRSVVEQLDKMKGEAL